MSPNERRHFARVSFDAIADLVSIDTRLAVRVLDLSLRGALLEVPDGHGLGAGQPVLLRLPLDLDGQHILMGAEIAHVSGTRMGLHCRTIELDSVTLLRRLIEVNLGDHQLLERELGALLHQG